MALHRMNSVTIGVPNVEETVHDNDTPGMFVKQIDALGNEDGRTLVVEGTSTTQLTDKIELSLAMAPATGTPGRHGESS